jgi:hypothetical protein
VANTGTCSVEVRVNDRVTTGAIAVAERPIRGVERTLAKLEHRVKVSGGVVTHAGDEARVARAIAMEPSPAAVATESHPMRTAWWMLAFAGCVSIEWWLRRRSGSA